MSARRFADAYELTPVQQGMLFHAQLDPSAGVYVVQVWTPLDGPLDDDAFEAAWRWAVARHPALRTGFVSEGMSRPMQVVHPHAELPWAALDWRGLSADEVEARREALLAEDRARGFDLAAPPLIRLTLARLADESHTLLWTLHHLVLDGWSHTQVLREVLAFYAAARTGTAYDPPAPRPYRDYVAWLRAHDGAADEAFWRVALEGVREPTPLGIDTAAPGAAGGHGAHTLRLAPDLSAALRERARALRVTQNTVFQGAWALVLSRYAGADDVVFGATTAGRPESLAGAGEMVGLFVNTLPVRALVSPQAELGGWLTALQARQAAAREHEHAALVDVQGWTELPRGRPLYESILAFESFPRVEGGGAETGGLVVGRLSGISRTGYPLTLVVHPGADTVLRCYHERGRIPDAAAGRVLGHLATVLAAFTAASAETRLGEIEILTAEEREALLRWGTGAEGLAEPESIPALLAAQAARTPDALAAEFADGTITYRELDARANRVARRLAALGVRPGDHVGLAAGQTCAMLAGLAGILRAGAAAVPLDPEYPAERLAFMLADTEARALVTRAGALDGVASPVPVLDLARDAAAIDAEDPSPVDASGPESIAYVIYTSGSTGRPKGVRVPHRAVVRTVVGTDHVQFGPGTRTAQQANLSFDASVWEIWGALLNGGTVVGIERDLLLSADYPAALRERRITDLFITAQLFNRHVRETPDAFATVGTVLAGGEALDPAAMRACLEGGPPRRLLNGYGPTECTVFSATHVITDVAADARGIPIGRPIAATSCRVLDGRGAPVPAGVAGELCLGGGRVAAGYLGRPELTAERFVPDPFADDGAVLYRTGDRVRWTECESAEVRECGSALDPRESQRTPALPHSRTGVLEYLGRLDAQVKVRGFRVEPGEIEAALCDDARVAGAAVIVREDVPGDRRLVAYVVARDGETADPGALRAALAGRLPEYMLPSAIVVLDALPLNRNGKVDRQALPAPDAHPVDGEVVAPRDAVEALLAELWADVLGSSGGVHVSFFEAGGHSLQAMQLATRIRQALRVELPLRTLFEAPTVAALAERVRADAPRVERTAQAARLVRRMNDAQIRGFLADAAGEVRGKTEAARRQEMVSYVLGHDATPLEDAPIVPREADGPAPLSPAQERLWVLDQLEPGGPAYAIPAALRLRGALDADALRRALAEIVRRHDALRTTFAGADGQPVQVVAADAELDFDTVDLSAIVPDEREDALAAYLTGEAARPFDLATGPLFRARLARLGDDEHALLIVVHHAVADGWSLAVLYRELSALYEAFRRGEPNPLEPLAVQYADFAAWQRERLASERIERQVEWWRQQLGGLPEGLELPADRPRPARASGRGAVLPVRVSTELAGALGELSRREGATLFMTLLAGFAALLHRWTGAEALAVGTPTAGRARPEVEGLIGFFVNTLVVRADLAGDPSFAALLARVRESTLGAWAHQDAPFERLVDAVCPERSLSRNPLFQVMLALQNAGELRPRLDGLEVDRIQVASTGARCDLTLSLVETDGGMEGLLEYATDLFDRDTAARIVDQLRMLLEAAAADPAAPVSTLPILSAEERRTIVEEWSGRETAFPRETVDRLFARQAAATPDAVALEWDGGRMTYAELDAQANQLARHLRRAGVEPGTRAALCLERSPELIVAALAVLKAGGAYVPLDPSYPAERLAFMLGDTAAPVVVTDTRLAERLPPHAARAVLLDRDEDAIAAQSPDPIDAGTDAECAAYVMYTSGSTGRPKGAEIPHRGMARLAFGDALRLGPGDVFLHFAPAAFDAAPLETWPALLNGARVALYPPEQPSVDGIEAAIRTHGVTAIWLTAGLFNLMVDERIEALRGVRHLLAGGDVLSPDRVRRVLAELPETALTNGYGPTENTTFTTCHAVDALAEGAPVPIGRPIADTRVYVLDARMQPVPVGVPGELYAGGAGLALGYVGRPELTAETFVASPFRAGERLYRTGDLVRWIECESAKVRKCESGSAPHEPTFAPSHSRTFALQFIGRVDQQVKIRGFRVEPGEVEAVLRAHPAVRDAAVVVRTDAPGEKRLVAYLVSDEPADLEQVHGFAAARLPEHMLPAAVVRLDALPLTANGKLDRAALPAPDPIAGEGFVAPRTATEETLAALWSGVLGAETVGVHDDFFALGGHSLRAAQLASRIRGEFGVELPLRAVFEASTVARMAAHLDAARGLAPASDAIRPVPRDRPLPLSFAQRRLWFLDRLEPGSTVYNVPVALRIGGALDVAALVRALGEIVDRHESLRTTFAPVESDAVQVIAPPADLHLPMDDLSASPDPEAEAHRRAREDADALFDLAHGPLFRARLLRLGADDHVLLLAMHHAVSDGWSMGVLFRELRALYGAFAAGEPSPLEPLPVQYADFAVWQRATLSGEALDAQLAWWRKALDGAPALLELPLDHPRPAVQTYRGACERTVLPRELADALGELARRERATPFMVLLAAYQALLARWSGQDDVVVGTPVAGRTRKETERLIGFFVNTLAVRGDVSGDPTFRALLGRVREAALEASAHQDLPFEKLVEEIHPARSQSHAPVFQAFFVLQNAWDGQVELPGLDVRRTDVEETAAKFDLSLGAIEKPEGLSCALFYNADLFEPATVRRMLGQLQALLAAAAADPARRLSELPLLTGEERARIAAWERGPGQPRSIPSFAEQLAAMAHERPHAVAVEHGTARVTYAELDARANRIAHRLRRLGAGPETRVAICLERTPELIAALVGVQKAGAAYVPLEPRFPAARIAALLAGSGAAVLIADDAVLASVDLPAGCAALSPRDPSLAAESADDVGVEIDPRTLAYVIYTSGSTGTPKGVMVTHGAVGAYTAWMRGRFPLAAGEKVLGATSAAFDVHVAEVQYALASGATLLLVENALSLAELAPDPALAHAQMVPSAARELLAAGRFPALPRVLLGGEPLSVELVDGLYAAGVGEVHTLYGPTEDTVFDTHAPCAPGARITIGMPLAGRRAYVLDASLRRTPVGVVGEIHLAGNGVARGYLGRPGLTAERFLPDPYGAPGDRMYASGDRARRLSTGEIEFLGRADFQVKVRGFRVEPGEIENVLRAHPSLADAVVAPRGPAESKRLAAWVVPVPGEAPDAAELAAWLKARLPAYMVPAAFVTVDALPRTASGKTDRNALPDPDFAAEARGYAAPRTETEAALAEVWAEVLKLERVGADDDFFALGGHSLLAMQVWGGVQQRFGIELPLRALFDHPTLAALAAQVDAAARAALPPVEEPRLVARRRTVRAVSIAAAGEPAEVGEE